MIVRYTANSKLQFEVECDSAKDAFGQIADMQECLDVDDRCACCQSENIQFSRRIVKDYEFFGLRCKDCEAQLDFGQTKDGERLFLKRKDRDGNVVGTNGWYVYSGRGNSNSKTAQGSQGDFDDVGF